MVALETPVSDRGKERDGKTDGTDELQLQSTGQHRGAGGEDKWTWWMENKTGKHKEKGRTGKMKTAKEDVIMTDLRDSAKLLIYGEVMKFQL